MVEQVLSHALRTKNSGAVEACKTVLSLFTPVEYAPVEASELLASLGEMSTPDRVIVQPLSTSVRVAGALEQMLLCLRYFVPQLRLGPDAVVEVHVGQEKHTVGTSPCLQFRFLGPEACRIR